MNDQADGRSDALAGMLELVEHDQATRTREVLEDANQQARELIRAAREEARARVRRAIREASSRAQQRLAEARADLATQRRHLDNESNLALLERAWTELTTALSDRWTDARCRRRWVADLAEHALAVLPPGRWHIRHPPGWDPAELAAAMQGRTQDTPELQADERIRCGLRIEVGGAILDGTEAGLLADRRGLRSQLLGQLLTPGGTE